MVATIQKEQDAIIRNRTAYNLIVDGRAGSGKTVIAMHRLAWLLYNYKTLESDNVMILSPNSIFGDYISEVLRSSRRTVCLRRNLTVCLRSFFS